MSVEVGGGERTRHPTVDVSGPPLSRAGRRVRVDPPGVPRVPKGSRPGFLGSVRLAAGNTTKSEVPQEPGNWGNPSDYFASEAEPARAANRRRVAHAGGSAWALVLRVSDPYVPFAFGHLCTCTPVRGR